MIKVVEITKDSWGGRQKYTLAEYESLIPNISFKQAVIVILKSTTSFSRALFQLIL
jgi:hypothetical protein